MISLFLSLVVIVLLVLWGLKTKYPIAFIAAFGISLITGFRWYDVFGTNESLAISLFLIVFSWAMAGGAISVIFGEWFGKPKKPNNQEPEGG